ncbi:hypothetical protein [Paraflavitalea speifideaquila]|nr:hypothetical protein [Paraflavitalea speifideiaquila]
MKITTKLAACLAVLLLAITTNSLAQVNTRGQVKGPEGTPLPGSTITEKW